MPAPGYTWTDQTGKQHVTPQPEQPGGFGGVQPIAHPTAPSNPQGPSSGGLGLAHKSAPCAVDGSTSHTTAQHVQASTGGSTSRSTGHVGTSVPSHNINGVGGGGGGIGPEPVAPTGSGVSEHGGRYQDKVYGNSQALLDAAKRAGVDLGTWNRSLKHDRSELDLLRAGIRDPTSTEGFRSVMNLTGEKLAHAAEAERQQQAEAASRRGYVGGYNPASTERARLEAIALASGEAAQSERAGLEGQFGRESTVYATDAGGSQHALGEYTHALETLGTTPTESWASDMSTSQSPEWQAYLAKLGIHANASESALERSSREREQVLDRASHGSDRDYNRSRDDADRADRAAQAQQQLEFQREQAAYAKQRDDANRLAAQQQAAGQGGGGDWRAPRQSSPGSPRKFGSYDPFF